MDAALPSASSLHCSAGEHPGKGLCIKYGWRKVHRGDRKFGFAVKQIAFVILTLILSQHTSKMVMLAEISSLFLSPKKPPSPESGSIGPYF